MHYRPFGRTGWQVSEIGYGMWGMAGWTGSDDAESLAALQLAVDLGCNFFDTAWAYGDGHSERLLGELLRANPGQNALHRHQDSAEEPPVALAAAAHALDDAFPPDYIREYAEKSLANIGLPTLDLMQFHVWEDAWADDQRWQRALDDLKRQGAPGPRHQHQPLGAGQRSCARCAPA